MLVVLQSLSMSTLFSFCTFCITSATKKKTLILPAVNFVVNMNNLFICIIMSDNNHELYLVSYFYKHIAFLEFFCTKELACSIIVPLFFDCMWSTIDETMQQQHFSQYINIYLHRECCKTSFIYCFIVTAENLIWLVVLLFSGSCWQTEELYLFAVLLINS